MRGLGGGGAAHVLVLWVGSCARCLVLRCARSATRSVLRCEACCAKQVAVRAMLACECAMHAACGMLRNACCVRHAAQCVLSNYVSK